jgi:HlyD family secretion protein
VPKSTALPTALGFGILIVGGCAFAAWAVTAPLDGAVVTAGSFVATGQNKRIQHLEGGIISDVLVREGKIVESGQALLKLDDTAARTKLRRLIIRRHRLDAVKARLEAQIQDSSGIDFPPRLLSAQTDPDVKDIVNRQVLELKVKREKSEAQKEVLRKEIAGLEESITGYEAQAAATRERLKLFTEELEGKKELLERQLARKTEVLSLRRAEAGLAGELGELVGRTADVRERIARANQQIAELKSAAIEAAVTELRQTESELDDVEEQIRAAEDVLERTTVRAPVKGIVVRLYHHTTGGVIGSGASILDLVPLDDALIIEARVRPNEITRIEEGQSALVRLSALNQRVTPAIEGKVTYVSADKVKSGEATEANARDSDMYLLRVELDPADRAAKVPDFKPLPGMPAEVFVKTGERTFFEYIMRPVADSFSRAFREQ